MVHAFLILTHGNWELLLQQVLRLQNGKNRIFIHVDAKSKIDQLDINIQKIKEIKNVSFVEKRINVQWGSVGIIKATIALIEQATQFADVDYLHLLSGQCFLVKDHLFLDAFFYKNKGKQFINYFVSEDTLWHRRIKIFHFHEFYNPRSKAIKDILIKNVSTILRVVQKGLYKIGWKRSFPKNFPSKLFFGSAWWSIDKQCALYIVRFLQENKSVLDRFKFTQLPDECFVQTIVLNSEFANSVENNNVRYLKFFPEGSSFAAELNETDIGNLAPEDILIARKFSPNTLALADSLINKN